MAVTVGLAALRAVEPRAGREGREFTHEVWVVRADGSGLRQLTSLGGRAGEVAWVTDGNTVRFVAASKTASTVCAVALDGVVETGPRTPELLPRGPVAWSPDSAQFAFVPKGWHTLYVADAGRGQRRVITEYVGTCLRPRWSPDGRRLAFNGWIEGARHLHSYVAHVPTGEVRELTCPLEGPTIAGWSPDGRQLMVREGVDVSVVWADGGSGRTAKLPPGPRPEAWSPYGRQVALEVPPPHPRHSLP